jgi:hypothetical protein
MSMAGDKIACSTRLKRIFPPPAMASCISSAVAGTAMDVDEITPAFGADPRN